MSRRVCIQIAALLLIPVPLAVATAGWHGASPEAADPLAVSIEAAGELDGPILWADARTVADERASLEPRVLLHPDDWEAGVGELLARWEPGVTIIVFCDGGACSSSRRVEKLAREARVLEMALGSGR